MASIVKKCNKYYVVYRYLDDKSVPKQKWECFNAKADASKRKKEIEFQEQTGILVVPKAITVAEMLEEFVSVYGINKWALSTYQTRISLINNYINPLIGNIKIEKVNTRVIDRFYITLSTTKKNITKKTDKSELVTPHMIHEIHKLLSCAFNQAIKWEMIGKNPCKNATLPKKKAEKRDIWDADTLFKAIELCEDSILKLALHVAFAASLRQGELLGLTWDCVNISDEAIEQNDTYVQVDKELQRVTQHSLDSLNEKDVILKFPTSYEGSKSIIVLKSPKTESSIRKVFIPKSVAKMLQERQTEIERYRDLFGVDYNDYNLVFCNPDGRPLDKMYLNRALDKLIKEHNLPPVVFHSIRHASITYKLKLTHGDMKAVQGDSGHSQMRMIADVYSHIIDEDRKRNASIFEDTFYGKEKTEEATQTYSAEPDSDETEDSEKQDLIKLLDNPQVLNILKAIASNLG